MDCFGCLAGFVWVCVWGSVVEDAPGVCTVATEACSASDDASLEFLSLAAGLVLLGDGMCLALGVCMVILCPEKLTAS